MEENLKLKKDVQKFRTIPSSSIFQFIPVPLWQKIFEILKEEKKTLKSLRLVCKLFRNLISPFWKQIIPSQKDLSIYINAIKKLNFELHYVVILNLKCYLSSKQINIELDLKNRNNKVDEFCAENYGTTPLFLASFNGRLDLVQLMLNCGADVNKSNIGGETSLYIAAFKGNLKIVDFLLKNGADVNKSSNFGYTPLFVACQGGHLEIVELLLKNGADVNKSNNDNQTPLSIACNEKILQLLRKHGAK